MEIDSREFHFPPRDTEFVSARSKLSRRQSVFEYPFLSAVSHHSETKHIYSRDRRRLFSKNKPFFRHRLCVPLAQIVKHLFSVQGVQLLRWSREDGLELIDDDQRNVNWVFCATAHIYSYVRRHCFSSPFEATCRSTGRSFLIRIPPSLTLLSLDIHTERHVVAPLRKNNKEAKIPGHGFTRVLSISVLSFPHFPFAFPARENATRVGGAETRVSLQIRLLSTR